MTQKNVNEFKYACREFLTRFAVNPLRTYARTVGVSNPTVKKKGELIEETIAVLVGEIPAVPPSKRGAPVKNDFLDPKMEQGVKELLDLHLVPQSDAFDFDARMKNLKDNPIVLTVEDPKASEYQENGVRKIFKGQLTTLNNFSVLLPLDGSDALDKVIISVELIRSHDLREGDVITCYCIQRQNVFVATTVLTVNGFVVGTFRRNHFDACAAIEPHRQIHFYTDKANGRILSKCLEWLLPLGRGQRGLVMAPPKCGTSTLLAEVARIIPLVNDSVKVLTLLVDQSPECIAQYRNVTEEGNLVYTTYEDDTERQVFVAKFLLNRAKRYAEKGEDVVFIVDSINALARAYNDTEQSSGGKTLPGGLESKTVQFLKRFLGAARCLDKGGSITILGALSTDTGNPADDVLKSELTAVANYELYLSEELARRRIHPAIDISASRGKYEDKLSERKKIALNTFLQNEYLPKFGTQKLFELLASTVDFDGLERQARQQK